MAKLRQHLKELTASPTAEALWDIHCKRMADFGFDRILYGFSHFVSGTSYGDPNDFVLLTNHDSSYMERFIGDGLYRDAPMTRWAASNEGACSWTYMIDRLGAGSLSEREKSVLAFNRAHGVTAGYSISFKAITSRSKGAIALTARKGLSQEDIDAVWAEHGEDIVLMNNVAHLKILTLPHVLPGRRLTRRQREALEWVGDGKTTQDIAQIMGLTPPTIEKHLRLAREALDVETTAQAVLKATFHNQMFVVDPI